MMKLPSGWYPVAESKEVPLNRPIGMERFGRNLVFWRHQGKIVVMDDSCPHRSAKLSLGEINKNCIVCPFHGFQFTAEGACAYVPETKKSATNLEATTYNAVEKFGLIFVCLGDSLLSEPEWFSELESDLSYSTLTSTWKTHITRCIENQLDYAHLPFVHRNTIGHSLDPSTESRFELEESSIVIFPNPKTKGYLSFKFPNTWILSIVPQKFYQFIAFVPVNEFETKLYLRAYQGFVTVPVIRDLVGLFNKVSNDYILNQDKRVVMSQPLDNTADADYEKLYPSDKAIAHFRKRWKEESEKNT